MQRDRYRRRVEATGRAVTPGFGRPRLPEPAVSFDWMRDASLRELAASFMASPAERAAAQAEWERRGRGPLAAWFELAEARDAESRVAAGRLPVVDARAVAGFAGLARDYLGAVRLAVAANPEAPSAVVAELVHDPDGEVASAARGSMNVRFKPEQWTDNATPSAETVAFHRRLAATLDETPHALATRAAMARPGWVAPEDAEGEIRAVAAAHGLRVKLHEGAIPGPVGVVEIEELRVNRSQRGEGRGSAGLAAITELADRHGWPLALHPSGDLGGDVARLRRWYARHGFVPVDELPQPEVRLRAERTDWIRYPRAAGVGPARDRTGRRKRGGRPTAG